jgi:hypothetical protein
VTAAEAYSSSAVTVMVAAGTYDENDTIDVPSGDTLTLQGAGASVTTADGGGAGPVFTVSSGTAAIDDLSITDGSGAGAPGEVNGGGVDNTGGTVTLTGDTLSNNAVLDYGGAVSNGVGATVTLTDDTLVGNSAFGGGGIYNKEGTATLTNDTLSSDSAVWGGALYNYLSPANATLTDDTLSNDTGTTGPGGIYNDGNAPTISDSVLDGAPCEGSITDGGYNVESDDSCGFGSTSVVNSSNINLATSLAANGSSGPETLAIGTNSSAYAEVPIANCTVTTDERGAPRPGVPGPGARCDAGAFEYTSSAGSPVEVGNTGPSSNGYLDSQLGASSAGVAYEHSTPAGRTPAWYGLASGTTTPVALSGLPGGGQMAGVRGSLVVIEGGPGVVWENLNGTGSGSGPVIPAAASYTPYPAQFGQFLSSAAPGGWVTLGTPNGGGSPHLLMVSTSGTVTDLGSLPAGSGASYSFTAGPDGVVYQMQSATPTAWTYVPYATPGSPVSLASDTSSANTCVQVLSSDAICVGSYSGGLSAVLVPLDGSATKVVTVPSSQYDAGLLGTVSDAAWIDTLDGTVSYEPWGGGSVTTISTGTAIPVNTVTSDGTNLIFSGDAAATAGIASLTPPSTSQSTLLTESTAPTEATGVALTPGRVAWSDDSPSTATLSPDAGPLWDRSLTDNAGTLDAGASANLVVTDASGFSQPSGTSKNISGRRTLYASATNSLILDDPSAPTPETTVSPSPGAPGTAAVSGSRVLYSDNSGNWHLYNAVTGVDSDLSATIPSGTSAALWGDYVAYEETNGAVYRWDISNLSNTPVQVLGPAGSGISCGPNGFLQTPLWVAGDYVAWSESCSGADSAGPVIGYEDVNAPSPSPVDLTSIGDPVAMSGSYLALVPPGSPSYPGPSPDNPIALSDLPLGTTTPAAVGTASGPVSLDGSTIAWVDQNGDVQAEALPALPDQPRYLGNGSAPTSATLPGTWDAEWDASAAFSACSVTISQSATTVATLPCDPTDMSLGEAVVSWNGQNTSHTLVSPGNYTWTLTASNSDGALESPTGTTLTLTGTISVAVTPPAPPTDVTATAGVDSANVTWSPPSTGATPTSYVVSSTPASTDVTTTSISATMSGLTAGVSYTFTVAAVDSGGDSSPSAPSNAIVPTAVAPQGSQTTSGTNPSATTSTASSTSPTGTTTVTAAATGTGAVTVATYASDPEAGFEVDSTYFDVSIKPGSDFSTVTFTVCGLLSGAGVSWWNPSAQRWQLVSDATAVNLAGCSTVTIGSTTSPSLSQLYGTIFAIALPGNGYRLVASDGGIFSYGDAQFYGSTGALHLNKPIVGMAATPDGKGYWLVASDGGIFSYGDAQFYGSTGALHLNKPIVGMAATPDGGGYWLVASDGGIFSYGDAQFYGSTGAITLNKPIVGMAATPDGKGYWLVASDGGIFSYGDAQFYGSTGALHLNKPIVGMAATPDGGGYWLVASDGGIFSYGDAQFYGSTGAIHLNKPIVGMAATPDGGGYWLVASDGGIFGYGDAQFYGSTGALTLNRPIVGMAPTL